MTKLFTLAFATLLLASCASSVERYYTEEELEKLCSVPRWLNMDEGVEPFFVVYGSGKVETCSKLGYLSIPSNDKQGRMSLADYRDSAGVRASCAHYKRASYDLKGTERLGALDDYETCLSRRAEERMKAERRR